MPHHQLSANRLGLLNFVANQPDVLAKLAPGYSGVDLGKTLRNPGAVIFGDEDGVLLFAYLGDGVYEGHYLLTDSLTPRQKMARCRAALKELFTTHAAWAINGATPRGNLAARAVNRALGFRPVGSTHDTLGRSCIKYRLERSQWEALSAAQLER